MTDRDQKPQPPEMIWCVRLKVERDVDEHRGCPYCWGQRAAVETGDRARFCDYDPAADPVCFGFPEGTSRQRG